MFDSYMMLRSKTCEELEKRNGREAEDMWKERISFVAQIVGINRSDNYLSSTMLFLKCFAKIASHKILYRRSSATENASI